MTVHFDSFFKTIFYIENKTCLNYLRLNLNLFHSFNHAPLLCLPQRPLRAESVWQPATEHGFFLVPPCLMQCCDPPRGLVVQPSNWHLPLTPCLPQRLRATARVVQPLIVHSFVLPPPCNLHSPLAKAAVVQLLAEQNPMAPCLAHSPRALIAVSHPAVEHILFPSCFLQRPRTTA